ncbi:MAG: EamA family transporter [Bacillota bacterium]
MTRGPLLLGYAAALGSAALVGLFTVVNKWLLTGDMPALTAGAWTYGAAGVALIPWALRSQGLRLHRPGIVALWLLAGLAGGIWLSWPAQGGGMLSGGALGNLLIAFGYLGWALENNLGRVLGQDTPAVTLVCIKALAASVVMSVLALGFRQPLAIGWRAVPGVLVSGAVALALSLALFYWAMGRIGAGKAGLISSTSSLWGVLAALTLLGETLTTQVLNGGLLMLLGLGLFAWDAQRQPEVAMAQAQAQAHTNGPGVPPPGR